MGSAAAVLRAGIDEPPLVHGKPPVRPATVQILRIVRADRPERGHVEVARLAFAVGDDLPEEPDAQRAVHPSHRSPPRDAARRGFAIQTKYHPVSAVIAPHIERAAMQFHGTA